MDASKRETNDPSTRLIGEITSTIAGVCICIAILILTLDAIGRHFGYPVPGGTDLVAFFMAGIVYVGMVALQVDNRHLRMDLLGHGRLPRWMELLPLLLGLSSMLFIAYYGSLAAVESVLRGEINDSAIDFPVWPARILVATGSMGICVVFLLQLATMIRSLIDPSRRVADEPPELDIDAG